MKLNELIKKLAALEAQGHGDKQVFYRHGASGDCGPMGTPRVTSRVDDQGPFDLDDGEEYVSVYVGN